MPDPAAVGVARLARSCARFLGRVPLVSPERLSGETKAVLGRLERVVADLLRQAADVLVDYANGSHGADGRLAAACARFAVEAVDLQPGLDDEPALGLLRDVFTDVVTDAAKIGAGARAGAGAGAGGDVITLEPTASRPARRPRAAAYGAVSPQRRRRPAWQPPADPEG